MNYLVFMLTVLALAMAAFMAGIVLSREKVVTGLAMHQDTQKSMRNAFNDSLFWGVLFFVSFAAEFILLEGSSL